MPASTACTDCKMASSPVAAFTATRKPWAQNVTDRSRPSQYPSASASLPSCAGQEAISAASARAARSVAVPATTVPVDP